MKTNTIRLNSKIRGVALVCSAPDARYRRYHTGPFPADEVAQVGRAVKVRIPARYQEREGGAFPVGTLMCAAYDQWQLDGRSISDPCLYVLTPVLRDGSDAHRAGCGQWDLLGEELIPADDPELLALRAEISALDAAWLAEHVDECRVEDRRTDMIARSTVHDESGRDPAPPPPSETECLECGAVYDSPGNVEPGGMSCRRCS